MNAPSGNPRLVAAHSALMERALRVAASAHQYQTRKCTEVPYITHPFAVVLILQQHGFTAPHLLAAALLHDVLEDTSVTADDLSREFPDSVTGLVLALTEKKVDSEGRKRPWRVRKEEHLAQFRGASREVRALALADKLHNLCSMLYDMESGEDIWGRFNASQNDVLWYHQAVLDACCDDDDPELLSLVRTGRDLLLRLTEL